MGSVSIYVCTWNMNNLTSIDAPFSAMLGPSKLANDESPDMFVLGTQECGLDRRTWQSKISDALGADYELLCLQEIMPIKLCIFVKRSVRLHISDVESADIPLKLGGALKTKGAVS